MPQTRHRIPDIITIKVHQADPGISSDRLSRIQKGGKTPKTSAATLKPDVKPSSWNPLFVQAPANDKCLLFWMDDRCCMVLSPTAVKRGCLYCHNPTIFALSGRGSGLMLASTDPYRRRSNPYTVFKSNVLICLSCDYATPGLTLRNGPLPFRGRRAYNSKLSCQRCTLEHFSHPFEPLDLPGVAKRGVSLSSGPADHAFWRKSPQSHPSVPPP